MSKKKSKIDWKKANEELETWMYENGLEEKMEQFGEYHWRITTYKVQIDIWHGSKKYWVHGTGGSRYYQSLDELKKYL